MKIGIVGAGQLGRMLGLAAIPMGIECEFLDKAADAPAAAVGRIRIGSLEDSNAITALARDVDVLTPEIENVSAAALDAAARFCRVAPPAAVIAAAQDRVSEKRLFETYGIPTAEYAVINSKADAAALDVGHDRPRLIKTRRLGYDGRGQRLVRSTAEAQSAFDALGGVPAIAEALVEFEREVSLIAVRGRAGDTAFYPLCENSHRDGILESTIAPWEDARLQAQAEAWVAALMQRTEYVGVLTVELFVTAHGLVANEMAPRVHNSGHWTIEGAHTSQFENHLRAIAGLPLGDTAARGHAAMLNLVGEMPDRTRVLAVPGAHLHEYGKLPRPGRKLGHCTVVESDRPALLKRLKILRNAIS
ncbi:MAG TPA: 5-(carboxyamino)imidazole ribonucleotide synthase [Gammaproteobacteria bacterium]|nr:5-(carboxyamino)imidazole ribonucleotide synthase [Gammaproteobacteria bacterium]